MENKKYQQALIQQAKLQNTFYNYTTLQPCAYFWKQLLKGKQTPSILVPDTLIMNDKETPMIWIFTNSKGKLQKCININFKDFINKITNYCSPNQLAATLKKVTYNDHYINGNDVKLLNARYLQNASFQQLGGQSEALITLQRYIKSNGNNPFICRTIWRKQKHSECFIITNKKSYYDQNQPQAKRFIVKVGDGNKGQPSPSRIVKAIQGKHLTQTCKNLTAITDYMKLYRGVAFSQMVGDFIKDEAGNWWLINIKAFQVQIKLVRNPSSTFTSPQNTKIQSIQHSEKQSNSQPYQKQKYQKTKICRYCQKNYLESELTHYMTTRMLIETDRYLLHLGKDYKWLRRSDIQNVDSHCLYQQHKICERCYRLYMQIQNLMQIENVFLKKLGFQLQKKPKQLLMSLTNEQELKNQSKNKQLLALASCFQNSQSQQISLAQPTNFPKTIQLGPNSNIIFQQDIPTKNDHMINTMIRYRMIIYLKELDQVEFPQFLKQDYRNYNFFLEYELFGVKNKIKLDFSTFNPHTKLLSIKKLKINYFFAHSHQDVHQYLNHQDQDFVIKIYAEPKHHPKTRMDSASFKTRSIIKKTTEPFLFNETQKSMEKSVNTFKKTQNTHEMTSTKNQSAKRILLGRLRLPIKEFFNNMVSNNANKITKKDFYKFFSVNEVPHGWGLEGSIGIIPSQGDVSTSRMIFFTQDNLIYLPNDNYYYCEHLPEEWIDVMKKELNQGMKNNTTFENFSCHQSSPLNMQECISEETQEQAQSVNFEKSTPVKQILKETQNISEKSCALRISVNTQTLIKKNSLQTSIFSKQDENLAVNLKKEQMKEQQVIKCNKVKNSWKELILKEEIEKYERPIKKYEKKDGTKTNIDKLASKTKLY